MGWPKGRPRGAGKKQSQEHIEKRRQALLGRKQSPEHVQKRRLALLKERAAKTEPSHAVSHEMTRVRDRLCDARCDRLRNISPEHVRALAEHLVAIAAPPEVSAVEVRRVREGVLELLIERRRLMYQKERSLAKSIAALSEAKTWVQLCTIFAAFRWITEGVVEEEYADLDGRKWLDLVSGIGFRQDFDPAQFIRIVLALGFDALTLYVREQQRLKYFTASALFSQGAYDFWCAHVTEWLAEREQLELEEEAAGAERIAELVAYHERHETTRQQTTIHVAPWPVVPRVAPPPPPAPPVPGTGGRPRRHRGDTSPEEIARLMRLSEERADQERERARQLAANETMSEYLNVRTVRG